MFEKERAELARVQKELAEKVKEAESLEALFWRWRETPQKEAREAIDPGKPPRN